MNKVIIAFSAGIVLGILYAPAKGKHTRNKIANLGNDVKDSWNNLTDRIAGKIDGIRESVDHMADTAVERIESVQFDTENRLI